MLAADEIRTFPCPQCGEIISTGESSCSYCGAAIDPATAAGLAERQAIRSKAFAAAHSMVITSRAFLLFYGLTFLPFIDLVGVLGVLVLLVRVPYEGIRWHTRYWKLDDPHPDVRQARRWFKEAMGLWLLGLLAAPVWLWLRRGGGAR